MYSSTSAVAGKQIVARIVKYYLHTNVCWCSPCVELYAQCYPSLQKLDLTQYLESIRERIAQLQASYNFVDMEVRSALQSAHFGSAHSVQRDAIRRYG